MFCLRLQMPLLPLYVSVFKFSILIFVKTLAFRFSWGWGMEDPKEDSGHTGLLPTILRQLGRWVNSMQGPEHIVLLGTCNARMLGITGPPAGDAQGPPELHPKVLGKPYGVTIKSWYLIACRPEILYYIPSSKFRFKLNLI